MVLFQVLKFDGPTNVLVWKHPKTEMNTGSQLVVGPAQEAVFARGGHICDVLEEAAQSLGGGAAGLGVGAALGMDDAFCSKCGKPAGGGAFCPKCGAAVQPGSAFCAKCGQALGDRQS